MVRVIVADYSNPSHANALVSLLDDYARDPMGGGAGLSAFAKENLVSALAARSHVFSLLALEGDAEGVPVGLANCIEGFSTFACKPLVNVHDLTVLKSHRGRGIAQLLLAKVEAVALQRGACKLTLEVLSGNTGAVRVYERAGFANYQLDPNAGHAQFMQKWLG
jgi:GNAT superfamily N-acetyltransferase